MSVEVSPIPDSFIFVYLFRKMTHLLISKQIRLSSGKAVGNVSEIAILESSILLRVSAGKRGRYLKDVVKAVATSRQVRASRERPVPDRADPGLSVSGSYGNRAIAFRIQFISNSEHELMS